MGNGPLLRVEHVSKTYRAAAGTESLSILRDISLELADGETLAIVGPSGSGKSTLLQIIGTLDHPDSGQVWLDGKALSAQDERSLAAIRNRDIGLIFQAHHLLPHCTVWENVLVPTLAVNGTGREDGDARAERLLKRVGLIGRIHHRPGQLSG